MKRFVLCAAALLSLSSISSRAQKSPEEKLNMTMYAIMNMYVDTVDKASFVDGMIARAMNELDPFSAYLTPEEVMASEAALLGPTAGDPSAFPVNAANAGESSGILGGASGTVRTAYIADKKSGTGYIRLTMFAEHTLDTAILAHALCLIGKEYFGKDLDAERCAVLALFHDAAEILTGDMPTPIKYRSEALRSLYKEVEDAAEERY